MIYYFFFFSSRRRHTRLQGDWSSDVCSSDLNRPISKDGERLMNRRVVAGLPGLALALAGCAQDRAVVTRTSPAVPTVEMTAPLPSIHEARSEERRVGKECRSRWAREH